jgi:hypothetical protein
MQKVEGSNPFSRSQKSPAFAGFLCSERSPGRPVSRVLSAEPGFSPETLRPDQAANASSTVLPSTRSSTPGASAHVEHLLVDAHRELGVAVPEHVPRPPRRYPDLRQQRGKGPPQRVQRCAIGRSPHRSSSSSSRSRRREQVASATEDNHLPAVFATRRGARPTCSSGRVSSGARMPGVGEPVKRAAAREDLGRIAPAAVASHHAGIGGNAVGVQHRRGIPRPR